MKKLPELRFKYKLKAIRSLEKLSLALSTPQHVLIDVAQRADSLYRLAKEKQKSDGTKRQTFDALPELKEIQIKIKERLLKNISYPTYLMGSLKERSPRKNASVHVGAKIAFAEDIENFFPSIDERLVKNVWKYLFCFSDEVSEILTKLSVKDGGLPQGAVTSSYLSNLVFWEYEPNLVGSFRLRNMTYTRYIDDISVSSKQRLSIKEQSHIVSNIYGMLLHHSVRPKRSKHEVFTAGRRMQTTKLVNNKRAALPNEIRQNTRAAVFQLEKRVESGERGIELSAVLASVSSRVGRLGSFHKKEANNLKLRLKKIRAVIYEAPAKLSCPFEIEMTIQ
jgi:retron-type reverse transcriptase